MFEFEVKMVLLMRTNASMELELNQEGVFFTLL